MGGSPYRVGISALPARDAEGWGSGAASRGRAAFFLPIFFATAGERAPAPPWKPPAGVLPADKDRAFPSGNLWMGPRAPPPCAQVRGPRTPLEGSLGAVRLPCPPLSSQRPLPRPCRRRGRFRPLEDAAGSLLHGRPCGGYMLQVLLGNNWGSRVGNAGTWLRMAKAVEAASNANADALATRQIGRYPAARQRPS